jgi:hypothetical protein
MPFYSPDEQRRDFDRVLAPFLQHPALPFADVLTADDLRQACQEHDVSFGTACDAVYTPPLALWGWLSQGVHKEKACLAAALRVGVLLLALAGGPCDTNSGTYCRARAKLPSPLLSDLAIQVGRKLQRQVADSWLWCGRHVQLVDGLVVDAPDTPENQRRWPQPPTQKPGLGFPVLRLVLVVSLITACVQDLAWGSYEGKETGETALFRRLLAGMVAGDVVVFDRYYCSYCLVALMRAHGLDLVVRLHQRRTSDFRRGRRLGPGDHVVVWQRPQRPEWMTVAEYATIPETLTVREILVTVPQPGFRPDTLVVVTTRTDGDAYSKEEIRSVPSAMASGAGHPLAEGGTANGTFALQDTFYDRESDLGQRAELQPAAQGGAQAALLHGWHPRQISFTATKQEVEASWQALSVAGAAQQLELGRYLLREVSQQRVGDRPDRCEPRAVKRRPKQQQLLMKPRGQAKADLLRGRRQQGGPEPESPTARPRC